MPSGNAYRPGDIIKTRQGLRVEVTNTDAEGRGQSCPTALTEGASEQPEIMIDFATLTGAARVALGPDLPAVFSNRPDLAQDLVKVGDRIGDPAWQMPLYKPYRKMLDSVAGGHPQRQHRLTHGRGHYRGPVPGRICGRRNALDPSGHTGVQQ